MAMSVEEESVLVKHVIKQERVDNLKPRILGIIGNLTLRLIYLGSTFK